MAAFGGLRGLGAVFLWVLPTGSRRLHKPVGRALAKCFCYSRLPMVFPPGIRGFPQGDLYFVRVIIRVALGTQVIECGRPKEGVRLNRVRRGLSD